ncbi:hypothetical protein G9A89_011721 [Geosiphon pyriformis]|nr:hypothetical protein G9A89_011721 [Geosiphon pyriformis]
MSLRRLLFAFRTYDSNWTPFRQTLTQTTFSRRVLLTQYQGVNCFKVEKLAIRLFVSQKNPQKDPSVFKNPSATNAVPTHPTEKYAETSPVYSSWIDQKLPANFVPYAKLARLDRPIGTWLLYIPCTWSISMAAYNAHLPVTETAFMLALFGIGSFVMRGAGCTINDMWDYRIDKMVERTRTRPLASGEISQFKALCFLGVQLSAGLAVLTQLNLYSILLGAASLSFVTIYPYMKRVTYWPQLFLGFAFNWGALLGWPAMLGSSDWSVTLPLYASGVCWTLVYDTIYAHQDKSFDLKVGVKSTALLFDSHTREWLTFFSGSMISFVALAGYANGQGIPFYLISVLGAGTHFAWQLRTTNFDDITDCGKKFRSNKWTVSTSLVTKSPDDESKFAVKRRTKTSLVMAANEEFIINPDNFFSHSLRYKSIYSKEKQQQSDPAALSENVFRWLTLELGYQRGRASVVLEDANVFDLKTDIQKVCKRELVPVFKFLMERVKSSKEVADLRRAQMNKRHQIDFNQTPKPNRNTPLASSTASMHVEENPIIKKAKLEKKLTHITENVNREEEEIELLIAKMADIEFQIKRAQNQIREKKTKMHMKEVFRDSIERFKNSGRDYQDQLGRLNEPLEIRNEIKPAFTGNETTLKVRNTCENIKKLGRHLMNSKNTLDPNFIVDIKVSLEELKRTTTPKILLKSVSNSLKSDLKEIKIPSAQNLDEDSIKASDDRRNIEKLLLQSTDNHVLKFIETEKILNDIEVLSQKIKEAFQQGESYISNNYQHIPSIANYIITVIKSKAEMEAAKASLCKIRSLENNLKNEYEESTKNYDILSSSIERIKTLNEVLDEKQYEFEKIIRINQKTRANITQQQIEVAQFVERLYLHATKIEDLIKFLEGFALEEVKLFHRLDLREMLQVKINGRQCLVSSLGIHRALDNPFLLDLKKLLHTPIYMSAEKFFMNIIEAKAQGMAYELAHRHFTTISQPFHHDLHKHVRLWLAALCLVKENREKNPSFAITANDMERAIKRIIDLLEEQEKSLLSTEQNRLEQENHKAELAETILNEIQGIFQERDRIISGKVGNRLMIHGRSFADLII